MITEQLSSANGQQFRKLLHSLSTSFIEESRAMDTILVSSTSSSLYERQTSIEVFAYLIGWTDDNNNSNVSFGCKDCKKESG